MAGSTAPRTWRGRVLAAATLATAALAPALVASTQAASPSAYAGPTQPPVPATMTVEARPPVRPLTTSAVADDPLSPQLLEARLASTVSRAARSWVLPVASYRVTARFGDRGSSWQFRHTGLDFQAPAGTPVRAVADARVAAVAYHPLYGRMVVLATRTGVTLWYCHLSRASVDEGDHVRAGERIGRIGTTGNASGPHLHLEVRVADRPTDPAYYLFGSHHGQTRRPPGWLPPQPITTVAGLAAQAA
jgi:murein DD-endopeptidase MepM/ murein hydrolase activator NlpD